MTDLPILSDGLFLPDFLPRLVNFTHEDRAAKGLRVFADDAAPEAPVHFTAFEMVSMHRAQLLHAPRGGGKTVLAQQIAAALPDAQTATPAQTSAALTRPAVRNPDGLILPQAWEVGDCSVVSSVPGQGRDALDVAGQRAGGTLLVLDGLEREPDPAALVQDAMNWVSADDRRRVLLLCESGALEGIRLHPDLRVHGLLPLPAPERAAALAPLGRQDPVADPWIEPGLWAVCLQEGRSLTLAQAARTSHEAPWLDEARDAARLARLPAAEVAQRVTESPARWSGPLRQLVAQGVPNAEDLAAALAQTGALPQLLAAADLTPSHGPGAAEIAGALARVVEKGGAAAMLRRRAGAALARLGDPRALDHLAEVPAGRYRMGGDLHHNSAPTHEVDLQDFRIGICPVTCGAFQRFAEATGHSWAAPAGRANHPATDLTWHDARAYCGWLTSEWRREGRISSTEVVRLPTEREWEAAARGPEGRIWPWGDQWAPEHANDEETGFNDICAVGLFPEGASPFGCLDMAGQCWEWCTTLWGDDMTTPGFAFPWADDGRESLGAAPQVRRVLRGGCFSSGRAKANGVYRGSLEPHGFWRGNGFRIVVA